MTIPRGVTEKWHGSLINEPEKEWNSTAEIMMQEFATSGHPVFKCTTPASKGVLKSKGGGWTFHTLHSGPKFCGNAVEDHCRGQPAPHLQGRGNLVD